jgi:predicted metal-dependent hydrolase
LIEANHSEHFWMHIRRLAPRAEVLHSRMRDAWKRVPVWAQPGASAEF